MEDSEPPKKRLKTGKAMARSIKTKEIPESPPYTGDDEPSQSLPTPSATPKKRRQPTDEPKERKSEFLNLRQLSTDAKQQKKQLATLFQVLNKRKKIVVIAGAGISTGAGIPDFRSATGLFATVKNDYKVKASGKLLFDALVYKDDKSTSSFHDMVRDLKTMSDAAQPTTFHHLLASLASNNRLLRLYTQNVDCIETSLPPLATQVPLNIKGPWPKSIQLHGGLDKMVCQKCGALSDFESKLFKGCKPPDCPECVRWEETRGLVGKRALGIGKLRPRIVLYNEFNPDADAIGAVSHADLKSRPDAIIVVGTSLKIPGVRRIVREMCALVQSSRNGRTIWINEEDPPGGKDFEGIFDLVIKGDCEKVARLANVQQWDLPPVSDGQPITSTGKLFGFATPQSIFSDSDSPLSSPVSYASSDDLEFEKSFTLNNEQRSIVEVVVPSPSFQLKATTSKKTKATEKKVSRKITDFAKSIVKPQPSSGIKAKQTVKPNIAKSATANKPKQIKASAKKEVTISKAFKASKINKVAGDKSKTPQITKSLSISISSKQNISPIAKEHIDSSKLSPQHEKYSLNYILADENVLMR